MQTNEHQQMDEREQASARPHGTLLLAIGLVAAAATLVLAVLPQPQARGCGEAACAAASPQRNEVVAVIQGVKAPAPPIAEIFRTIRSADAEGGVPPIPPSETWPAQ